MRKAKRSAVKHKERKGPRKMTLTRVSGPEAVMMQCRWCDNAGRYASINAAESGGWEIGDPGTLFLGLCPDCHNDSREELARDLDDERNTALLVAGSYR